MNLDQFLSQAEDENNDSMFEMLDSYEALEHIKRNPSRYPNLAKKLKGGAGKTFQIPGKINSHTPGAAAQFDIVITRNTNNIVAALPVAIFMSSDAENGYRQAINTLPAGVTLTSVRYGENVGQPTAARFTFFDGALSDTIDVTCNQYPYPSVLSAMKNDLFRISMIRLSLTDTTATAQFSQSYDYKRRGMFGTDFRNSLPITAAKSPDQFQNTILDVSGEYPIDPESGLVFNMIRHTAAYSLTFSCFIQKAVKMNAVGL